MATNIVYLFPDTNLFIQCRPLAELDWSTWDEFDEVHLIVTRPVQREIDKQKNRGSDRIGKRARKTHFLFRELITGEQGYKLISEANPQVKLLVEPSCRPSPELADQLDYHETDDALVGCVHAYLAENSAATVRLLTHNSGPMGTAKMLDLLFVAIPDSWLISPETTEDEKKISHLENDLLRLKKTEPEVQISCLDDEDCVADKIELELEHPVFEPLTDNEISEFIETLKTRFPLATDFGSTEPTEREPGKGQFPIRIDGMKDIYTPAPDEKITEYTETKYPDWIGKCKSILCELHTKKQYEVGQPSFCFAVSNSGTRPAKDVLIEIEAKGNFKICPPPWKDDDETEKNDAERKMELPRPPVAPQGNWSLGFGRDHPNSHTIMDAVRAMESLARPYAEIGSMIGDRSLFDVSALHRLNSGRDPNGFYYKPDRPVIPAKSFSLECEQWRHGVEDHRFLGNIFFEKETKKIRGALECHMHAENMSSPANKTIPVRIRIVKTSMCERAEELIAELIRRVV